MSIDEFIRSLPADIRTEIERVVAGIQEYFEVGLTNAGVARSKARDLARRVLRGAPDTVRFDVNQLQAYFLRKARAEARPIGGEPLRLDQFIQSLPEGLESEMNRVIGWIRDAMEKGATDNDLLTRGRADDLAALLLKDSTGPVRGEIVANGPDADRQTGAAAAPDAPSVKADALSAYILLLARDGVAPAGSGPDDDDDGDTLGFLDPDQGGGGRGGEANGRGGRRDDGRPDDGDAGRRSRHFDINGDGTTIDADELSRHSDDGDASSANGPLGIQEFLGMLPETVFEQMADRFRELERLLGTTQREDDPTLRERVLALAEEVLQNVDRAVADRVDIRELVDHIWGNLERERRPEEHGRSRHFDINGDGTTIDADELSRHADDRSPPGGNLGEIFGTGLGGNGPLGIEEFLERLPVEVRDRMRRGCQGLAQLLGNTRREDDPALGERVLALAEEVLRDADRAVADSVDIRELEDHIWDVLERGRFRPQESGRGGGIDGERRRSRHFDDDNRTGLGGKTVDADSDEMNEWLDRDIGLPTVGVTSLSQLIRDSSLQDSQADGLKEKVGEALEAGDNETVRDRARELARAILPSDPPPDENARKLWESEFNRITKIIVKEIAKEVKAKKRGSHGDAANGPKGGPRRDPEGGAPGAALGGNARPGNGAGGGRMARNAAGGGGHGQVAGERQEREAEGGASERDLKKKVAGKIKTIAVKIVAGRNEEARKLAEALAGALEQSDGEIPKLSAADILKLAYEQTRPSGGRKPAAAQDADGAPVLGSEDDDELDKQMVNRVDWENFFKVYGIEDNSDEAIEKMKLTARKAIRDPEKAHTYCKSILKQLDRKTVKIKSARHLSMALVDAVERKSDRKKLTKPLKMKAEKDDA